MYCFGPSANSWRAPPTDPNGVVLPPPLELAQRPLKMRTPLEQASELPPVDSEGFCVQFWGFK